MCVCCVFAADLLHGGADVVHSGAQPVPDRSDYGERHPLSVPVTTLTDAPPNLSRHVSSRPD